MHKPIPPQTARSRGMQVHVLGGGGGGGSKLSFPCDWQVRGDTGTWSWSAMYLASRGLWCSVCARRNRRRTPPPLGSPGSAGAPPRARSARCSPSAQHGRRHMLASVVPMPGACSSVEAGPWSGCAVASCLRSRSLNNFSAKAMKTGFRNLKENLEMSAD